MKRLGIFILPFVLMVLIIPSTHAAAITSASLSDIQLYPKDDIWNVPVDGLPKHPLSATYVASSSPSNYLGIGEDFPINVVNADTPRQYLSKISMAGISDNIPYPIPVNALVQSSSDHHMLMVDTNANKLYELYDANQNTDGTWWAEWAGTYDLTSYALRPENQPSADAAGLPLIPGIIRYDEVESGSINHALRLDLPTSGNGYVWPARSGGVQNSASYPPMGQRFRLKDSFDISGFNTHQKVILTALKKYGVMLADNIGPANYFGLSADPDSRWGSDIGYLAFQSVHFSDFEAVDVSSLMINKDSGKTSLNPSSTQVPTPTPTPTPVKTLTSTPTPTPTPQSTPIPTTTPIPTSTKISETGLYNAGTWNLDNNGDGGFDGTDKTIHYGTTGDLPVAADWNNDSSSDIGVFRPSNGNWYLDYNNNGVTDKSFHFGKNGDIPLVGDWNKDGTADAAVFRPSSGNWYIDFNANGGADKSFHFGKNGDIPLVGDWNGDGTTDVAVFRPSNGNWYLDTTKNGTVSRSFHFGTSGDIPVVGDWNGDKVADTAVFRPSNGTWYLDTTKTGTVTKSFRFGKNGDIPVTGTWV